MKLLRYLAIRRRDGRTVAKITSSCSINWREIHLRTLKTGGEVFLPVPKEMEDALAALPFPKRIDGEDRESGHIFWNGITTKRAAVGCAERNVAAVFRKSGVVGAKAHRFRHTLASEILAAGGTLDDVADILGISVSIAKKHYAKWTAGRQQRVDTLMRTVLAGTYGGHEQKPAANRVM